MTHSRSSRERYRKFLQDYKDRKLDEENEADQGAPPPDPSAKPKPPSKRREYVRDYLRWLRPHRYAIAALFGFALVAAGLEMIEPLFMRYIIDRVLLNTALDSATRLINLNLAGAAFVSVVILSNLVGALKDYRQRLLNTRVILSLRRSLFGRLLHLPMEKLWEMK